MIIISALRSAHSSLDRFNPFSDIKPSGWHTLSLILTTTHRKMGSGEEDDGNLIHIFFFALGFKLRTHQLQCFFFFHISSSRHTSFSNIKPHGWRTSLVLTTAHRCSSLAGLWETDAGHLIHSYGLGEYTILTHQLKMFPLLSSLYLPSIQSNSSSLLCDSVF